MFSNKNPCRIALDFDQTVCRDPIMWSEVVEVFKKFGHHVMIVTGRCEHWHNVDIEQFAKTNDLQIYYCNCRSKVKVMNGLGLPIDIWIDDIPQAITTDWDHENEVITRCYTCDP